MVAVSPSPTSGGSDVGCCKPNTVSYRVYNTADPTDAPQCCVSCSSSGQSCTASCSKGLGCIDYLHDASFCMGCGVGRHTGNVQYCGHCDRRFCPKCLPHECRRHTNGYHWRRMPIQVREIVEDAAKHTITMPHLVRFLLRCIKQWPSDKEFDARSYQVLCESWASAYVLSGAYFLSGQDREGVYMLFYAVIMEDMRDRGPNRTLKLFERMKQLPEIMNTYLASIKFVAVNSGTRTETLRIFERVAPTLPGDSRKPLEYIIRKLYQSRWQNARVHNLPQVVKDNEQKANDNQIGFSIRMNVTVHNVDTGKNKMETPYADTSMWWLLKLYRVRHVYHTDLQCPEITLNTKYFRVMHKGRTLFHSTWGKWNLHELGMLNNAEITVGGEEHQEEVVEKKVLATRTKVKNGNNSNNKKKKASKGGRKKKKKNTAAYL